VLALRNAIGTKEATAVASFPAHITIDGVAMAFGSRPVFHRLDCHFPRGALSVILGGSGSGKSTILRMIGGLVRPQAGRVLVDGEDVTRCGERELYHVRRKLGMLFQGGALLDSLSVFDNLAFPLRERTRLDEAAIARIVHEKLAAVGLQNVDRLLPRQLSGGMVKRVGLARALIGSPEVLLCDEPFSGLDPITARRIEGLLARLNRASGMTMVVVSHDVGSTRRLADHVVLVLDGGAVQGSFAALQESASPYVRAFLAEDIDETLLAEAPAEVAG